MYQQLSRRGWLAGAGALAAFPGVAQAFAADASPHPEAPPQSVAEALTRLTEGNVRFASGNTRHAHQNADWRKHLVGGQKPFATVLGCSDSRVPIELVFDQGFGDIFVIRVAGNVIAPDIVGSLEYALAHLQTQLVIVLGHEGCGAVTAALQAMSGPTKELPGIQELLNLIEPGLPRDLLSGPVEGRVNAAVEANVRWSLRQLAALPSAAELLASQRVTLLGAVYELGTGRVRLLEGI